MRIWDAVRKLESRGDLARVRCPTLLLQGARDWLVGHQQEYLACHIAGAQQRIIPAAGHAVPLENAAATTEAIRSFLANASSP